MAQRITAVMAIGASSFLAPTAPAIAMAAETPQTAPPTPSMAASRRSMPQPARRQKITRKVTIETIEACRMATGPAQISRLSGRVAPSSTMPVLT